MPPEPFDDLLGSYQLVERLGRGASGEVWRAVDRRTQERVATKLLHTEHHDDDDLVRRFLVERSVLRRLTHPAIVSVRDLVAEGDRIAIVMELVEGGSLRDVLRQRRTVPPTLALGVTAAVFDALATAHKQGVVHRDVKPDNVLLTDEWWTLHVGAVKLVDFGIARIMAEGRSGTTSVIGTPEYMSPELLDRGTAEAPSDVYGAGIMLYELIAGRTPFAGSGTALTIAKRHSEMKPPPLPVPDELAALVDSLLEKSPDARPTAAEAAARLRELSTRISDLGALPPQHAPDPTSYVSARGPMTEVRHVTGGSVGTGGSLYPPPPPPPITGPEPALDLGAGDAHTVHRPVEARTVTPPRPPGPAGPTRKRRPGWRDPRLVLIVVGCLVLIGGAVLLVTAMGGREDDDAPPPSAQTSAAVPGPPQAVQVTQTDPVLPSGLIVGRTAAYDPDTGLTTLTIGYSVQGDRTSLSGELLEVLPLPGETTECAGPTWPSESVANDNVPQNTGISTDCAWSLTPGSIDPGTPTEVTATFELPLSSDDAQAELQAWLGKISAATLASALDPTIVRSTAYPVQRLEEIRILAPTRTVSNRSLELKLYPVWAGGNEDRGTTIYLSPAGGAPSSILKAVAGGESGIRFSGDGCGGGLNIVQDGLAVTTDQPTTGCVAQARVGNFDAVSNTFDITDRG